MANQVGAQNQKQTTQATKLITVMSQLEFFNLAYYSLFPQNAMQVELLIKSDLA